MEKITATKKDHLKKMYILNLISNLNANYAAVKESELYDNIQRINKCLEKPAIRKLVGGKWNVVWGPAIGNTKSHRTYFGKDKYKGKSITRWATDNAMYVAQKEDTKEYFIGISGTNGISLKGWFEQDFDVSESVPWPPQCLGINNATSKDDPRISKASNNGIEALWKLKSKAVGEDSETRLIDFLLSRVKKQTCSISVGGHSLGGCLTPLVATAIADKMDELDRETKNDKKYTDVKINAYPTAGPTPGNQAFANHLQKIINEYHAVYNTNDLVPLAWDFKELPQLKKTYKEWKFGNKKIDPNARLIVNFLHGVSLFSKDQNYVRNPKESSANFHVTTWDNNMIAEMNEEKNPTVAAAVAAISGIMYHKSIIKKLRKIYKYNSKKGYLNVVQVRKLGRFLLQVLLQHVPAYSAPSASNTEIPWSISKSERNALKEFFDNPPQKEEDIPVSKRWAIATGIVMLSTLAEKVIKTLEENPNTKPVYFEEETVSDEIESEELDMEILDTEAGVMAALEQVFKESPQVIDALPFLKNPYA